MNPWLALGIIATLVIYARGGLPSFLTPNGNGGGGMTGETPDNGGVVPGPITTLPGGPVINCIREPCPQPGQTDGTRTGDDPDAPWWLTS